MKETQCLMRWVNDLHRLKHVHPKPEYTYKMNIGDHLFHSFIENSNALYNILPGGQWPNDTRGAYGKILVQPTIVAVTKNALQSARRWRQCSAHPTTLTYIKLNGIILT